MDILIKYCFLVGNVLSHLLFVYPPFPVFFLAARIMQHINSKAVSVFFFSQTCYSLLKVFLPKHPFLLSFHSINKVFLKISFPRHTFCSFSLPFCFVLIFSTTTHQAILLRINPSPFDSQLSICPSNPF